VALKWPRSFRPPPKGCQWVRNPVPKPHTNIAVAAHHTLRSAKTVQPTPATLSSPASRRPAACPRLLPSCPPTSFNDRKAFASDIGYLAVAVALNFQPVQDIFRPCFREAGGPNPPLSMGVLRLAPGIRHQRKLPGAGRGQQLSAHRHPSLQNSCRSGTPFANLLPSTNGQRKKPGWYRREFQPALRPVVGQGQQLHEVRRARK
jgi:hypothetical protein